MANICKECGKEFSIIKQEEVFYEKKKLPLPVKCLDCRRKRREDLRNERKLYDRKCDKCGAELQSSYPTDSPYRVYCEKCYLEEK